MSTSVDPRLEAAEQMFKIAWENFVRASLATMYVNNPWMTITFIRLIIEAVAWKTSDYVYENFSIFVDTTAIKILNKEARKNYEKHSVILAIIIHEKGVDSDEFKKARANALVSMSRFTRVRQ